MKDITKRFFDLYKSKVISGHDFHSILDELEGYANKRIVEELEIVSTKFVIEIGEDGDEDYRNEISLHDTLERIKELK